MCLNPNCGGITTRTGRKEYGDWEISLGGRYRRLQEEFKCVVCGLVFVATRGIERENTNTAGADRDA